MNRSSNSPSLEEQHESLADAVKRAGMRKEKKEIEEAKEETPQADKAVKTDPVDEIAKQTEAAPQGSLKFEQPRPRKRSVVPPASARKIHRKQIEQRITSTPVSSSPIPSQKKQPERKRFSKSSSYSSSRNSQIPATAQAPARRPAAQLKDSVGMIRHLLEALVLLALAVTLFRTFALEGFMISTGSMAPTLRGYHYRIVCPDCQFQFAWTATEKNPQFPLRTLGNDVNKTQEDSAANQKIICPNCDYRHISSSDLVINEGDQLLVDKLAFEWNAPRRWSSVVFRNPHRPTQAYAKRIVGLPGEVISLKNGDIYVRGKIQRKNLAEQRQMRVLVSDSAFRPQFQDENFQDCWVPLAGTSGQSWRKEETGYRFEPQAGSELQTDEQKPWLAFRRWIRNGGVEKFTTSLDRWPGDVPLPTANAPINYDEVKKMISCRGALPADVMLKLKTLSSDITFHSAIEKLFNISHTRPITDQLAYNQTAGQLSNPVRDLMVQLEVEPESIQSQLIICMNDGEYNFFCQFDFASREVKLMTHGNSTPLRTGQLPEMQFEEPVQIEMSVMDRQVLVAVNTALILEPYAYRTTSEVSESTGNRQGETPQDNTVSGALQVPLQPIRIGAAVAPIKLKRIRVYRDLFYRQPDPGSSLTEYRLQEDELFVLGDNSEVSVDSRDWPAGSVNRNLLIGRPLILHLPSMKKTVRLGPVSTQIRVPDSERIRMLR